MFGSEVEQVVHAALPLVIERTSERFVDRPLDLERGPFWRCVVRALGANDHEVYLSMHHIVSDGWSMGVMLRELGVLYRGEALAALPIQYADYALWQRQHVQLDKQLAYWTNTLTGAPAALELPMDYARPAIMSNRGAVHGFVIEARVATKLKQIAQEEGATLFMAVLAAFEDLLMRYSGQDDIVIGTPIANRQQVAAEALIGFFVNTLCMRVDASGDPSFRQLLGRAKTAALSAYAHQDVPFEKLVDALQPERSTARSALFQVMLVFQNAPLGTEGFTPELALTPLDVPLTTTKFDLSLNTGEAMARCGPLLNTRRTCSPETITRMANHFTRLCEAIVSHPDRAVAQLEMVGAGERQRLSDWNRTERQFSESKPVHELVAEQARKTPGVIAATFEGATLTYQVLNEQANQSRTGCVRLAWVVMRSLAYSRSVRSSSSSVSWV